MPANVGLLNAYADQADWQAVSSSNVRKVGYLKGFPYVFVEFRNGSRYVYYVPDDAGDIYRGVLAAPSKGKAVNGLLKANFSYDRLR